MSTEIKALILCNNPIAIPGIKEFLFYGNVAAIVVTKRNKEMQRLIANLTEGTGVPLLIVTRKNFIEKITSAITEFHVNVGMMMTFPFILPEELCKMPAKGFINFHYGLLPQCRGPQPILWHLLNHHKEAGITVHKVDEGIDTGEIIMQEKVPVLETDTYGILQSKIAYAASKPAATLLKILSFGSIIPSYKQDETKAVYYEMPNAKDLTINWQEMSAVQIRRIVNACNPWNKGAGALINDWVIGITEVEIAGENLDGQMKAGQILECNKDQGLLIKTMDNKIIKITIAYISEGFFSGYLLQNFGISKGMIFN